MSLSSTSVKRPITTLMFFIGVVILGVISFQRLSLNFLPDISIPKLTIQTSYPNAAPEEVETFITEPIESSVGTVSGVRKITSVSREGLSIVTVEFYWGTDMDFALLDTREKLDGLRSFLPRDAGRPTILHIDPSTEPIMTLVVSGRQSEIRIANTPNNQFTKSETPNPAELAELKETARALIKRRLEQIEGVAQAVITGGLEREIHVDLNMRLLNTYGLTIDNISQSLQSANLNLPGGNIRQGLFRYALRTLGEFQTVDDIRKVVVGRGRDGSILHLSDVAKVEDSFKERRGVTRFNGKETIGILVRKEAGANTVKTSEKVRTVVQQLNEEYPNLHIAVVFDQAEYISKSISDVEQAILLGAILAFLVLFLFLHNFKYPVIIGIVIPISILATFVLMYFSKISLNIISLTGLALGIGMLGDNAIIVIENISRLREKGMSLLEATLEGAKQINLAAAASTFTNVAIFLPIIFVEGIAQQLFRDMGLTMTFSLLISLIVAVTLVPMLVSRCSRKVITKGTKNAKNTKMEHEEHEKGEYIEIQLPAKPEKFFRKILYWLWLPLYILVKIENSLRGMVLLLVRHWLSIVAGIIEKIVHIFFMQVDKVAHRMREWYNAVLIWSLNNKMSVLLITLLLFLGSILLSFTIESKPAPDIDQQRFTVVVQMPKGSTLEATSSFVRTLEEEFLTIPAITGIFSSIGVTEEQTFFSISQASLDRATIDVRVKEGEQTEEVINLVRSKTGRLQRMSDAQISIKRRGTTFEQILRPEPDDIKIRIIGKDLNVASDIAERFTKEIQGVRGLVDLRTGLEKGNPEYRIEIDREKVGLYGLTVGGVASFITNVMKGNEATYLSDFDRKIAIRVRPEEKDREAIEDLLSSNISIGSSSTPGKGVQHVEPLLIPLREIINYKRTTGYAEIWRENQTRGILLLANVSGRSIGSVISEIEEKIENSKLPAGYTIKIGGENEEIRESFRSLLLIILLSIFLVYMILAAEYESIVYPLVIILTSPLAFIGAVVVMFLAGQSYNVMSLIGLVIMIGAVDNDAVIALDFIIHQRRAGLPLNEAVVDGMNKRLRSILMTTATTILGVLPLVLSIGVGLELATSLTWPIFGGLFSSTLFTLVVIPVVYTYFDKIAMRS